VTKARKAQYAYEAERWREIAACFLMAAQDSDRDFTAEIGPDGVHGLCGAIAECAREQPGIQRSMHRLKKLFRPKHPDGFWWSTVTYAGRMQRVAVALKCAKICERRAGLI